MFKIFLFNAFVLSQVLRDVLPRHAIRKRGLCCRPMSVRLSVSLSVCLSRLCILTRRLKISPTFFLDTELYHSSF